MGRSDGQESKVGEEKKGSCEILLVQELYHGVLGELKKKSSELMDY